MKTKIKGLSILLSFWLLSIASTVAQNDTLNADRKFSAGILPAIAYDSDLGLQYGLIVNLFNYTPQYAYPNYANSLYLEASKYTAGSVLLRLFLDSKQLTSHFRTNMDLTYIRDLTNDFLGYNGAQSVYNDNFEDENHGDYISRMFYKYDTGMLRFMTNFKGQIGDSPWQWITGLSLLNYKVQPVDIEKFNKRNSNTPLPITDGLFDKYTQWGIIKQEEKEGGFNTQLRVGLAYDSRNNESNPSRGIWGETLIATMPNLLSSHNFGNVQITTVFRQYLALVPQKTIFAYRLQWQHKLSGKTPYYLLSAIPASWLSSAYSEGLGGAKTLRGIKRNRVIGDGYLLSNIELRQKLVSFNWLKQDIYIATNIFADAGRITQYYNWDLSGVPTNEKTLHFNSKNDIWHTAAGLGLKIALNENFIVSADYGKAFNKQDGDSGLYINLNYLF